MLRMTACTSAKGAKEYFGKGLTRSDYYIDGQEIAGQWGGKTAQRLGLSGEVDAKGYFALCDNRDPLTGEKLTPRDKDNRRVGYDLTFSAPKAISVLYELSRDEGIRKAFEESYRETLNDCESEMQTRVRVSGKNEDRATGNMVWAEFQHFTARPVDGVPDPHLHAHCFVFNTTWDETEQRFKAGQFGDINRNADYYEAALHTRFAKRLNELGYQTVKDGTSFTLAHVPRSVTDKFSQRRNQIEKEAQAKGISDAKGKHAIGYYGRENKTLDAAITELRDVWRSRLSPEEADALNSVINGEAESDRNGVAISPDAAMDYALEHAFKRASTVSEKRLQAEALRYAVGEILPESVADIAKHEGVITRQHEGQAMATTHKVLHDEVRMLQFAIDGHRKCSALVSESALPEDAFEGLSQEQKNAALHLLTSRDTVTGVVGKAGTGKTRMMRATVDAIERHSHKKVFTFAPSSQASRGVLAKEGFKDAATLETLLKSEKLQAQVKGQIIWVDEAGLVSSRDMKRLMDVAKNAGTRIILSGDYTQHASVEAGDAFRLLEQEAGVRLAKLSEVRRQTEPGYKKAVESIAEGSGKAAQKGFDALDKMRCVIEATGEERHGLLVADYLKAIEDGKTALIIAPTHSEGARLTDVLRDALKERGALGKERGFRVRRSTGWTEAQKGDLRNYEAGMVVEFQQNVKGFTKGDRAVVVMDADGVMLQKQNGMQAALPMGHAQRFEVYRPLDLALAKGDRIRITRNGEAKLEGQVKGTKVNNGDIFTVEGFDKDGNIRLEKGRMLPKDYGHFSLGYVDTSYASQGKTVDRVFIAVGSESLRAANQQQWYVSASRGREIAKLYVEDKQEVRDRIASTGERLSAVELTGTKLRESWRRRYLESFERNRVARFIKTYAASVRQTWRGQERSHEVMRHG